MEELSGFSNKLNKMYEHLFEGKSGSNYDDDTKEHDRKRRKLVAAKQNHMETMNFLEPRLVNGDSKVKEQYDKAMESFMLVVQQINDHDMMDGVENVNHNEN